MGCGTGTNFKFMLDRLRRTGKIIGVDLSSKMIDIARTKFEKQGYSNIELHCMDARDYRVTEPIDIALFAFSLYAIPNYPKILNHIWKNLKNGGQVIIVDFKTSNHPLFKYMNPLWVKFSNHFQGDFSRNSWKDMEKIAQNIAYKEFAFGFRFVAKFKKN